MLKITTLLENSLSKNESLKAEHGLSFYVEMNKKRILFDASAGSAAAENAKKLHVSLPHSDFVVLSHSHYDHAGGYPFVLNEGVCCPLITGPHFWEEKYATDNGKYIYLGCGFGEELLRAQKIEQRICEEELVLFQGCHVIGNFDRPYDFEKVPKRFVKETENGLVLDDFSDEICLGLDTPKGVVLVTGCSHPGILNMTKTVSKRLGKPVYAVLGGSHLVEADEERVKKTLSALEDMGVRILGLNHCTGKEAETYLQENSLLQVFHLGSGDCFFL